MSIDNIIKTYNSFEQLGDEEIFALKEILAHSKHVTLKRGQYLWQEGDTPDFEAYVNFGILRQFVTEDNGNEKIIQFFQEEYFIHDCSGNPVEHCVQALEDCDLLTIKSNHMNWEQIMLEFPAIERVSRKVAEILMLNHKEHVNLLMKSNPEERYRYLLDTNPDLVKRISVTHLAQYLGISRETLSRIRAKISVSSIL